MRVNELRVGNILIDFEGNPTPIEAVEILAVSQCNIAGTPVEFLKPIPLTEDWLNRFGFEQGDNTIHNDHFWGINVGSSSLGINPNNGVVWITTPAGHPFNNPALINYVHQLQNIYFALTGVELILQK